MVDNNAILQYVRHFSRDQIVNASTVNAVRQKAITILAFLLFVDLIAMIITRIDIKSIINRFYKILDCLRIDRALAFVGRPAVRTVLIFALVGYFLVTCLSLIYRNDVGVDEGLYISSVKYFYEAGKFNLPWRDYAELALHLAYYPYLLLKPLVGFSVYSLRIMSLTYSVILLMLLGYYVRKFYSTGVYLLLLAFLVTDPAFIYISSSGYGEIPALVSFLVGVFFLTDIRKNNHPIIPAVFLALAGLTKLQLLPFIIFVLCLLAVFKANRRGNILVTVVSTCLFWVAGEFIFAFLQGYDVVAISTSFWRLLNESSALAESLPIMYRLAHVNAFFGASNIIIVSIIYYYYLRNFKNSPLIEKTLFAFALLLAIWWTFFFVAMSIRNLIYVLVINYVLVSIVIGRSVKRMDNARRLEIMYGMIAVFFCLVFVNTTIFNVRLANKGISDEFDYAISGYETFSRRGIESAQREFFVQINTKCDPEIPIYYISQDYYKYIFTDKTFHSVRRNMEDPMLPKGAYFILTYIDYKNDYVWDGLLVYLDDRADLVFKNHWYEIYKVND
jgi:hypothetical protein